MIYENWPFKKALRIFPKRSKPISKRLGKRTEHIVLFNRNGSRQEKKKNQHNTNISDKCFQSKIVYSLWVPPKLINNNFKKRKTQSLVSYYMTQQNANYMLLGDCRASFGYIFVETWRIHSIAFMKMLCSWFW